MTFSYPKVHSFMTQNKEPIKKPLVVSGSKIRKVNF